MAIYLLDFSKRAHGNPLHTNRLPPGAWALRATPYATTYGATWAQRIAQMEPAAAASLLSSLACLPGSKPLRGRDLVEGEDLDLEDEGGWEVSPPVPHTAAAVECSCSVSVQGIHYSNEEVRRHLDAWHNREGPGSPWGQILAQTCPTLTIIRSLATS